MGAQPLPNDGAPPEGLPGGGEFGPYRVIRRLGSGGMGEVFLAVDTRLGRQVAIKALGARLAGSEAYATQLLREARAVARLHHANIAQVYDIVELEGRTHIVMEYVEGESLADLVRRSGPMAADRAAALGLGIAAALEHAHGQGILHCDLKPANVFLTRDGDVKVLDFGLARLADASTSVDEGVGATPEMRLARAGTPAYMSPEQREGGRVTAQSDLFSLGLVLHELCTGHRPRPAAAASDSDTHTGGAPMPDASIPPPLQRVIAKALATEPARRPRSAAAFRSALSAAADELQAGGRRRRSRLIATVAVILLAVTAAGLWSAWRARGLGPNASLPVVMVLPFRSANGESSTEMRYLAAGLTELITDQLALSPAVVVVSNAAARAAGADASSLEAAASDVGASHVISAVLEPDGDRTRVVLSGYSARESRVTATETFRASLADVTADSRGIAGAVRTLLRRTGVPIPDADEAQAQPGSRSRAALEDYAQARELMQNPTDPSSLDRAMVLLARAVERDPDFAIAHAALGEAQWRQYRRTRETDWARQAQASAFEALRLAPDEARVRYTAAVILRGTGEPDRAADEVQRALALQPNSVDAHRLLGSSRAEAGDLDGAIEEFQAALRLQPRSAETYRAMGLAYFDAGRYTEAIDAFEHETAIRPRSALAHQLIGTSYHSLGRLDEALQYYTRATDIAPTALAYSNIGLIRYTQGRFQDAVAAYRRSAELAPRVPETYRNLGDSLAKAGDRTAAAAEYRRAIALAGEELKVNPRDARLVVLQAVCLAKLGRRTEARQAADTASELAASDGEVQFLAAVAHALSGDVDASVRLLARALELGYSRSIIEADDDLEAVRRTPAYSRLRSPQPGR